MPTPPSPTKPRCVHVDLARGLSILLVAFHHSDLASLVPATDDFFGIARMPLFFLLAGVFLRVNVSPQDFLIVKAKALLWPYVFTGLAYCIFVWLRGTPEAGWYFRWMAYGVGPKLYWPQMWFLMHLFVAVVAAYLVLRGGWLQRWPLRAALIVLSLCAWGATLTLDTFWGLTLPWAGRQIVLPGLPASADLLPYTAVFVIAGHLLRRQIEQITWQPLVLVGLLTVWALIAVFTDASMDLNRREHTGGVLTLIATAAAVYSLLLLTKRLATSHRFGGLQSFLTKAGQSSLLILVFHLPLMRLLNALWTALELNPQQPLVAVVTLCLGVVLPLALQPLAARSPLLRSVYHLRMRRDHVALRT
jgi:fucose 4-O-acetylase-like acetyltransferase